jgi:hypothetical protein
MPPLTMVAARAVTARPGPMEAASPEVAAARPASPFCPAQPAALIRPRSASGMACWTGGGLGFRVGPSDGGSQSASSKGRNCLVELIEIV